MQKPSNELKSSKFENDNLALLPKLLSSIQTGKAILFTGSGFSRTSINLNEEELPLAKKLANDICKLGNIPVSDQLDFASEMYLDSYSADKLIDYLKENLSVREINDNQKQVCKLKWFRCYTTNYDLTIEKCFTDLGESIECIDINMLTKYYLVRENLCIHLNGSLNSLTVESINKSFKLSTSSYLNNESFVNSSWNYLFLKDIDRCSCIVFIGYSLYDLDIQKILKSKDENIKNKVYFIVHEEISMEENFKLKKYGTVLKIGLEGFADYIRSSNINNYKPSEIIFESFEKYQDIDNIKDITDESIEKLLMQGTINIDHIATSLLDANLKKKYVVYRSAINEVMKSIVNYSKLFITSGLGNGKTVLLKQLKIYLSVNGYICYEFENPDVDYFDELDEIYKNISKDNKCVLLIDNYTNYIDLYNYINLHDSRDVTVIFFDRKSSHDRFVLMNTTEIAYSVDIDVLNKIELEQFIAIIDNLGLWRDLASMSVGQKLDYLNHKYLPQVFSILTYILESPSIIAKIKKVVDNICKENEENAATIISICILKILNINPTKPLISLMSGNERIYNSEFWLNKSFIDLFGSNLKDTSNSVIGIFILKNYFTATTITQQLLKIVKNIHNLGDSQAKEEKEILKAIRRFAFIERILPDTIKIVNLQKYYESLKDELNYLTRDPHFWLQYAMCFIAFNDFKKANDLIDTAYGLVSKNSDYRTYKLDNQKARLLLLECEKISDGAIVFAKFNEALNFLDKTPNDEFKIRRFDDIVGYYKKNYNKLGRVNKIKFIQILKDIKNKIENFDNVLDYRKTYIIEKLETIVEQG